LTGSRQFSGELLDMVTRPESRAVTASARRRLFADRVFHARGGRQVRTRVTSW
jgi:hypothetical protein